MFVFANGKSREQFPLICCVERERERRDFFFFFPLLIRSPPQSLLQLVVVDRSICSGLLFDIERAGSRTGPTVIYFSPPSSSDDHRIIPKRGLLGLPVSRRRSRRRGLNLARLFTPPLPDIVSKGDGSIVRSFF